MLMLGDGNVHVLIMLRPTDPGDYRAAKTLADGIAVKAIEMGGTCTGEHGVGTGKKEHLRREMGAGSMSVMAKIKRAFDPTIIMNPGKMLDVEQEK